MNDLKNIIADFINSADLFAGCSKLLAAVSGGADSVALVYILTALKCEGFFAGDIVCAHVNHQLRGADANLDEKYVVELCQNLGIKVITRLIDVSGYAEKQKLSIETSARQLRRRALLDIANSVKADAVLTAHHADDNAETILQRLTRGTGIRGLAGIWPVREFESVPFVRPMLGVSRRQIEQFLLDADIRWRQDHTNADCAFRRNFIRHKLIPAINENYNGNLAPDLLQLSQAARAFYKRVCRLTDTIWPRVLLRTKDKNIADNVRIDADLFVTLHTEIQVEILRRVLSLLDQGQRRINQAHYQSIIDFCKDQKAGKIIELPGQIKLWYEYGALVFSVISLDQNVLTQTGPRRIKVPGRTLYAGHTVTANIVGADEVIPVVLSNAATRSPKICCDADTECFDLDKLRGALVVRPRQNGDKFFPFGQTGHKKVGKFLSDQHIDKSVRDNVLIIEDEQQIVWVWPARMSEAGRVTEDTKRVLKLSITRDK
jgi:tRNA(Ile)-lysidine synthase